MENGLAIIEKTDTQTSGIFIDQDTIECARLNALTKKRVAMTEEEQRKASHNRRKAEKAEAKRIAYTLDTIKYIAVRGGILGAAAWTGMAGMASPVVCVSVIVYCLCTGCVKLGAWFGRTARK